MRSALTRSRLYCVLAVLQSLCERDAFSKTSLEATLERDDFETASLLLKLGADINQLTGGDGSHDLLHEAITCRRENTAVFLIDRGARLDSQRLDMLGSYIDFLVDLQ